MNRYNLMKVGRIMSGNMKVKKQRLCDSSTIDNIAKEFCKDENSKLKVMGSLVPSKVRKT